MSTEPTTTEQAPPAWGDPQPPAPKWSGRKTAIAAAVAIVIAAIGGVAIYAGTSSTSNQQGFGGPGGGARGGFNGGTGRAGGTSSDLTLLRDALHGDFTVQENGSYVTERMQTGQASALSATSVTVKSADGYTQTYAIGSSTQKASNLADGSTVTVLAKVDGNTATASSITDTSQAQQGGGQGGFPGGTNQNGGFPGGQNGGQSGGQNSFPGGGQNGFPGGQGGTSN